MENSKSSNDNETKTIHVAEESPNPVIPSTAVVAVEEEEDEQQHQQPQASVLEVVSNGARQLPSRTPFTNLSQVDADLALARTLQEQERAYMVLRMNGDGSDYGSWETGSYDHEDDEGFDDPSEEDDYAGNDDDGDEEDNGEDAFDVHAHYEEEDVVELDPASFPDDESYARALQDAEDRDMAERLLALAGISNADVVEAMEDHGHNSQDAWDDIDPDELSYEELIALGEMVGTESRGLSVDTIASLPSIMYKAGETQNGSSESCVICRLDFEEDETLTLLSCKHSYHPECINNWLCINKVCPVCSTEVPSSASAPPAT